MENVIQLRQIGVDRILASPSIQVNSPEAAGEPSHLSITDIAFDHDGTFVVEWVQKVDGRHKIYAQRFLPDGKLLGENLRISMTEDSLSHSIPNVLLRNGRIYSFWALSGGERARVSANVIDFNNPPEADTQPEPILPLAFSLHQNYPNPFNPATTISYSILNSGDVSLVIYNLLGESVTTLVQERKIPGVYESVWNGKDRQGRKCRQGFICIVCNQEIL